MASDSRVDGTAITAHFTCLRQIKPYIDVHVRPADASIWNAAGPLNLSLAPRLLQVYYTDVSVALQVHRELFASFPDAILFPPVSRPVGPHPMPMFEVHIAPKLAGAVAEWLEKHSAGLTALLHPHTGDVIADHLTLSKWVRGPLELVRIPGVF